MDQCHGGEDPLNPVYPSARESNTVMECPSKKLRLNFFKHNRIELNSEKHGELMEELNSNRCKARGAWKTGKSGAK
ncbi:MAG: hypothetical protein SynsKO_07950 [Synoicihabitans sp.]